MTDEGVEGEGDEFDAVIARIARELERFRRLADTAPSPEQRAKAEAVVSELEALLAHIDREVAEAEREADVVFELELLYLSDEGDGGG